MTCPVCAEVGHDGCVEDSLRQYRESVAQQQANRVFSEEECYGAEAAFELALRDQLIAELRKQNERLRTALRDAGVAPSLVDRIAEGKMI